VAARLLAEGRPVEAARRLADLVAAAPTYAAAHVLRATALEAAGQIDDALVSWGRAAALVPSSPLVHRERERLLATRVADEPPPDLPPAVPDPEAPPVPLAGFPSFDVELEGLDADEEESAERRSAWGDPLAAPLDVDEEDPADLGPDDEEVDGPLLDFGAPPKAPEPAAAPEADGGDPDNGPLFGYGEPQALDASDLFFGDAPGPPPAEEPPSETAEPDGAPEPAAERPVTEELPADVSGDTPGTSNAEWGADETGIAPVLPPEGRADPVPEPDAFAHDDLGEGDGDGWDVLAEADVPTPPPGTYAEPDVVAPEDPEPEADFDDPFADVDAVVDEFGAADPEPPADRSVADELDALISQLEDAPRIRPDPEYAGPEVELDHGEVDDMVSETLAKIYAAQHQYVEAAIVYEKLAARQPDQAEELLERAAELRQRGA
jgi:hypothetical protein